MLQFVLVKPSGALLKLYAFEKFSEHMQTVVRIIMYLVNNVSVSMALYGLVMFYHAAFEVIEDHRPLPKFISVKAVVFFSFWQGVAIQIAIRLGLLMDVEGVSVTEQATGLQDILICFEMFIAAVAHYFVFSYKEYLIDDMYAVYSRSRGNVLVRNFADIFDFRDVLSDARDRLRGGVGFATELRDGAPVASMSDVLDNPSRSFDYGATKRDYHLDSGTKGWLPHATVHSDPMSERKNEQQ